MRGSPRSSGSAPPMAIRRWAAAVRSMSNTSRPTRPVRCMSGLPAARAIVEAGMIEAAVETLEKAGLVYVGTLEPPKGKPAPEDWEPRPQTLFRSTAYGDDVDRPLKKADGSWAYIAPDIAYHLDKFRRGFRQMIVVLGADHVGYVKRMKAAVKALTAGQGEFDVKLCQLVNLLDKGEPVRMSERARH